MALTLAGHARRVGSRPTLVPAGPALELVAAAAAIATVYGLTLVATLPVWAGAPSAPAAAAEATPSPALGWPAALVIVAVSLLLCAPYRPYVQALRVACTCALSTRLVLVLTGMLALVALLSYPRLGSDLFDYVGYERLWVVYHANPMVVPVNSYPGDWAYPLVAFRDRPPAYGPLWVLITAPLVWLAGASASGELLAYKALSLVGYVGCCALIWFNVDPSRRMRSLLFFAWSPLVLVDVLGNVHNDVLPAFGVLLAVVCAGRTRAAPALAAGVAAGLVKASALAIAPVIALQHLRDRRSWSLGLGTALALGLAAMAYLPFWAGADTLRPLYQQTGRVIWSPGSLLILTGRLVPGDNHEVAARLVLVLCWMAGLLLLLRRARFGTPADTATYAAYAFLLSLLCLTMALYAHYLVPAVALAALSGNRRLEQLVTALSIGGLAAYGLDQMTVALGPEWFGSQAYQLAGSVTSLGPAGLFLLWLTRRRRALPRALAWLGRRV